MSDAINDITNQLLTFLGNLFGEIGKVLNYHGPVVDCTTNSTCSLVQAIVYSLLLFFILLTGFAYTTFLERKLLSYLQQRVGPNRAGPGGWLQPLADGLKLIFKEDITPQGADKPVYLLAPVLKTIPAIVIAAVIPIGPPLNIPWFDGKWYRVPLALGNVNVGVLFLLAFMSLGAYGLVLAGWSSNNKYSMLGSLRASAQMVSYELSMGLTMAVPIMITGTMLLPSIIDAQSNLGPLGWFVWQNPVSALILTIAMFAETNRAPFDLPEAESELTAGYHTEYSGMKFALFFMAEYISMITVGMIVIALFFGGYHFILVDKVPILGPLNYIVKVILWLSFMIWVRATLPRIRYDRLMNFGWKVMVPLALLSVSWTAVSLVIGDTFNSPALYFGISMVFFVVVAIVAFIWLRPKLSTTTGGEVVDLQPRGIGYLILQVIGAVLSVPFILFGVTQKQVRNAQAALRADTNNRS